MRYRVKLRDGTVFEDVDYDESMKLIAEYTGQWAGVQPMDYGKDLDPENAKRRKAWGM
jgi:hypothetical protein